MTRFVVQLEYRIGDEWMEVVRFDHDPESDHPHDVYTAMALEVTQQSRKIPLVDEISLGVFGPVRRAGRFPKGFDRPD